MKTTKKEQIQKELLAAGKELILKKGHEGVTVRSLAEATGYSHTNLYYYFKDLQTYFEWLRLSLIEDMIAELSSVPIKNEDSIEEILQIFYLYMEYFFLHPNVFRFFYFYSFASSAAPLEDQNLERRFQELWHASFARLIHEGIVEPQNLPLIAKTILYSMQGMILLHLASSETGQPGTIKNELKDLVYYLLDNKIKNENQEVE